MTTVAYAIQEGKVVRIEELERIRALLKRKSPDPVWVDSDGGMDELGPMLRDDLDVHPLCVEDMIEDRPMPKIEEADGYLYVVVHGVRRDAQAPSSLDTTELDILLGDAWIVTHRTGAMRSVEGLADELRRSPRVLLKGPVIVMHALLDRVAEHYGPVVDQFDDEIDEVAEAIVARPNAAHLMKLFALRRSLQHLRRVSTRQRDVLLRLARGEFDRVTESDRPFFRDVHDQFVRVADLADSFRELVTAAAEMHVSVTSNRTNEIMKVLAVISTLMLPLTFIAGVYGMNFENMPGLHASWGFGVTMLGMLVVAVSLLLLFRIRRWI